MISTIRSEGAGTCFQHPSAPADTFRWVLPLRRLADHSSLLSERAVDHFQKSRDHFPKTGALTECVVFMCFDAVFFFFGHIYLCALVSLCPCSFWPWQLPCTPQMHRTQHICHYRATSGDRSRSIAELSLYRSRKVSMKIQTCLLYCWCMSGKRHLFRSVLLALA